MSNDHVHPVFRSILDAMLPTDRGLLATEKEALEAVRKFAKAEEARWYSVIRAIDARVDEIEIAEIEQEEREPQPSQFNLGIKLENFCHTHRGARLPEPTTAMCADCQAERQTG